MEFKQPALTVDCVVFDPVVRPLLIQRRNPPFQGQYALPGGFLEYGETAEKAAARELLEETGLVGVRFDLIGVYSDPLRDPRQHVITIAYLVGVTHYNPQAGDDAATAEFLNYADYVQAWWKGVPKPDHRPLAFDHDLILRDGIGLLVHLQKMGVIT